MNVNEIRYTRSIDTSGWLMVKLEPSGAMGFVCEYTKVIIQKQSGGRTFFRILEGRYANQDASLTSANALKCLVFANRGKGATLSVKITGRKKEFSKIRGETLNQLFAELTFNGKKAKITIDSDVDYIETNKVSPNYNKMQHSKPLPKGTYRILVPESAKDKAMTDFYRTDQNGFKGLKYDTVWFAIEYKPNYNSSFVHIGHLSEGCITCYEIEKWNDLYQYLITNRTADGKYVGTLIIS